MRAEPEPRPDVRQWQVQIDGRLVSVPQGITVLRAAELAGVEIPSLCAHKELSPFGGCRLCSVEIAHERGYPLACSTLVGEEMEVTTESDALRRLRRQILELILSQHPSSCLACDESEECRRSQATIRKAGVSTGCRSCSNDGRCELQRVAERLGVTDIAYPVTYRGLEPEHDDPFFDRDYNLCILCGRCVRMCAEVRGASVLSFKYRGRRTLIGPAFGRSHLDAGCEFCGACVSVCPTGALTDKVSKWDGAPDGVELSTCPLCGLGCQVELAHSKGTFSFARAAQGDEVNDGQLCVLGRFCLPEATHHPSRARRPMLRRGAFFREAGWDEALGEVADRLRQVAPDELLMLVSSDLTNEGLFAAQRLVRSGLGSGGVDSTGRACLPGGPALWSRLFALPVSVKAVGEADAVIVAALDSRFSFSVAGVQVRRAMRHGAALLVVDARESNLARRADCWLRAQAGEEAAVLGRLLRSLSGGGEPAEGSLAAAAGLVEGASTIAVVTGPRVFECAGSETLVGDLEALAARGGVTVLPLTTGANIRGALELGVLSGDAPVVCDRPKLLYLVGEAPFTSRPDCDFVIAQDLYLPPFEVDAFLPAASFVEAAATLTSIEGRVLELRAVEQRPAGAGHANAAPGGGTRAGAEHSGALPDWKIFSELAVRLGRADLEYAHDAAVRAAIRREVPGFPAEHDRSPRRMAPLRKAASKPGDGRGAVTGRSMPGKGRFVLVTERPSFRHRGVDLAAVVEGLGELHLDEGLRMSPDDIAGLGIAPGDQVTVTLAGVDGERVDLVLPARADQDCPQGAVYVTRVELWGGPAGAAGRPTPQLSRLTAQPLRVDIRAGDCTHRARRRPGGERGHGR